MKVSTILLTAKPRSTLQPDRNNVLMIQGGSFVDRSPNAYVATSQGTIAAVSTGGKFNNGYVDNTNGRLNYEMTDLASDCFIEAWVQLKTTFNATWCHIVGKGNGLDNRTWVLGIQNRNLAFVIGGADVSGQFAVRGTSTLVANQWYHLSASKVGNNYRVFVNGTLEATGTSTYLMTNTSGFSIGDRRAGDRYNQYPTAGFIGGVRISINNSPPTASFTPPTAPWAA